MKNFMKTIINAIKHWTNGRINSLSDEFNNRINASKADWNQNDPGVDSYVKNRTHWEEDNTTILVPKTEVIIGSQLFVERAISIKLILGQTYKVIWNDKEYECICYDHDGAVIGNDSCWSGEGGNSEPFLVSNYDNLTAINVYEQGTYTISIYTSEKVVHKLDSKYLPDDIGVQSDWNENDETSVAYIQNRPFYEVTDFITYAEEQVVTFDYSSGYTKLSSYDSEMGLITGQEFKIIFDGEEYSGTIWVDGDACSRLDFTTNSGVKINVIDGNYMQAESNVLDGDHMVAIYISCTITVQIPERYYADFSNRLNGNFSDINNALLEKMDKNNSVGTGSFSMNRLNGSIVGDYSSSIGNGTIANHLSEFAIGQFNNYDTANYDIIQDDETTKKIYLATKVTFASSYSFNAETGHFTLIDAVKGGLFTEIEAGHYFMYGTNNTSGSIMYYCTKVTYINSSTYKNFTYIKHTSAALKDEKGKYLYTIGNGNSDTDRSNAHTLDWNGNAWYQGDIYVGSTSGNNKDEGSKKLATEEYVDDAIGSIEIPEGSNIELDTTLTQEGKAADAKAVGEALNNINVDGFVSYDEAQALTDEQKAQARANISQYEWRTFTRQNTTAPFILTGVDQYLNNGIDWSIADVTMSPTAWGQENGLTAFQDIFDLVEVLYFNDEFLPDVMADIAMDLDALIAANAGNFQSGITIMRNNGGDICKFLYLKRSGNICTAVSYREMIQDSFIQVRYNSSTHTIERYDDWFNLDKTLTKYDNCADAKVVGDALAKKITAPSAATVGQAVAVKNVDEKGAPIEWECVDISSDNIYIQNDEPTDAPDGALWVDTDAEGGNAGGGVVSDEQIAQAVASYLDKNPINVTGVVKSINGEVPDEDGDIEVTIPDAYTKQEIDAIMGAYINDIDALIGGDA